MGTKDPELDTKSAYRFGCLDGIQQPPSRPTNGNVSKAVYYQLPYFDPMAKSLLSSYTLDVQYVLYPTAQAAADEQRALEATVTPQCLHVGHESDPNYFPFDITSTAGSVAEAGFAGTSIHSVTVGTSANGPHNEDWEVEARSGALLVTVQYNHLDGPGNGTPFETDADNWVAKVLGRLATAGH